MTLDISRVVDRINDLIATVDPARDRTRFTALRDAWIRLDGDEVNLRFRTARTSFLLAQCSGDYGTVFPAPVCPEDYVVLATDGSFVLPSRHSPARFYLLNIGTVRLRYGERPGAELGSVPTLKFTDSELIVPDDVRRMPVNESILSLRRAVAELETLMSLVKDDEPPTVTLQDGTLILWALESQPDTVRNWVLPDYLRALRQLRDAGVPVASYISSPGSTDLVNTLRVSLCDYPAQGLTVNCDHCRSRTASEGHVPACDILPAVTDRYLLADIASLQPGQRTAVFASTSRILRQYAAADPDLDICFFYLNAGREIARVEIPRWVANDRSQLDLVHGAIVDQCRRGRGYPTALQEAHEQAVISVADRRMLEATVERALAQAGVVLVSTGKDASKRVRTA